MVTFGFVLTKIIAILLVITNARVSASGKVVCYYRNYNANSLARPENLDATLCTHINYAFVSINESGSLIAQSPSVDIGSGLYARVVNLKLENPSLKVLLSVGGVTANLFSTVAGDSEKRRNFVQSAKTFLDKYSFDGLDIDWEKPADNDADTFITLLRELRKEFNEHGWTLTAAVYPNPSAGYNVPEMAKYLDMFNVMCYNYYGPWSAYTGQNAALYQSPIESSYEKKNLNVASSVQNWINAGAPREKLIIGIPFYGRSFTLVNGDDHGLHAPITGAGSRITPTYSQICTSYKNWTTVWDNDQKSSYKYSGDQWLGYDDERSIKLKAQYIVSHKLGGAMIWYIGADDMTGECGAKQGLLKIINDEIKMKITSKSKFPSGLTKFGH